MLTKTLTSEDNRAIIGIPKQSHEPQLLGQSIVDLVLRVPVVHLFPLGHGRLFEELDHLHGPGVCWMHNFPKDLCAEPGHADCVAGQTGHDWTIKQKERGGFHMV